MTLIIINKTNEGYSASIKTEAIKLDVKPSTNLIINRYLNKLALCVK